MNGEQRSDSFGLYDYRVMKLNGDQSSDMNSSIGDMNLSIGVMNLSIGDIDMSGSVAAGLIYNG